MESSERLDRNMRPYPSMPDKRVPRAQGEADMQTAELIATLSRIADSMEKQQAQAETNAGGKEGPVWQEKIPGLPIPISGGTGQLTDRIYLASQPECFMGFRRLCVSGFSAGSVTAYINGIEPAAFFPTAGVPQFYGKSQLLIDSGEYLVFIATGITGQPLVWGKTDNFPGWFEKRYIA